MSSPSSWHSYPSIYNIGHGAVAELLKVPVYVEEKIDGSQFSFSLNESAEVLIRSKGAVMHIEAPEKMFQRAADAIKGLAEKLHPGWTYRAEYLAKPKHNTMQYQKTPRSHVIIFDINTAEETYLPYAEKAAEAARLGLDCVPLLFEGMIESSDQLTALLNRESILGGSIEGVVVKPIGYSLFGRDKKVMFAKYVGAEFKEKHGIEWKKANPTTTDAVAAIAAAYTTPARWQKAVQHLSEDGTIEGSLRDIGKLIKEIPEDILKDSKDEIKDALFAWAWPQIRRRVTHGFPEWYKTQLEERTFAELEQNAIR